MSAGISSQLSPGIQQNVGNSYAKVAMHAIVGGTISKATGGKFANGAYSAAFAAVLRESVAGGFANRGHAGQGIGADIGTTAEAFPMIESDPIMERNRRTGEISFIDGRNTVTAVAGIRLAGLFDGFDFGFALTVDWEAAAYSQWSAQMVHSQALRGFYPEAAIPAVRAFKGINAFLNTASKYGFYYSVYDMSSNGPSVNNVIGVVTYGYGNAMFIGTGRHVGMNIFNSVKINTIDCITGGILCGD